jgi:hypothetical protein
MEEIATAKVLKTASRRAWPCGPLFYIYTPFLRQFMATNLARGSSILLLPCDQRGHHAWLQADRGCDEIAAISESKSMLPAWPSSPGSSKGMEVSLDNYFENPSHRHIRCAGDIPLRSYTMERRARDMHGMRSPPRSIITHRHELLTSSFGPALAATLHDALEAKDIS